MYLGNEGFQPALRDFNVGIKEGQQTRPGLP